MKIYIFNAMAIIVLISSIVALIGKLDIGQSYLLPIWILLAMRCNNENKKSWNQLHPRRYGYMSYQQRN